MICPYCQHFPQLLTLTQLEARKIPIPADLPEADAEWDGCQHWTLNPSAVP